MSNAPPLHPIPVLHVEPPSRATVKRYSHRNGEPIKPTIEGYYGFRCHNAKYGWIVTVAEHLGEMCQFNATRYEEEYTDLPDGCYWGPLIGPWNEGQP